MAFDSTAGSFDFGFLPPNFTEDVQVFFSDNNAQGSQKWIKPRGVTMCYMVCIGGGGGGGGGFTGATTTARGGGAGGACSGIAKLLTPAIFLPDVLLVQVGNGGKGGGANSAGGAGVNSIISHGVGIGSIGNNPNVVLVSNTNAPGGGGAGTIAAGGTGGTVPTIASAAVGANGWGIPSYLVGLVGASGGAQTGAVGATPLGAWNTVPCNPGSGGAGVTGAGTGFAGGANGLIGNADFADITISPAANILAGTAGSSLAAGNGNAGIQLWKPFYSTGGSGGGSSDGSTGGNGGNGGIGSGGGGGGGGTTGGTGGNGGNGFVAIISW